MGASLTYAGVPLTWAKPAALEWCRTHYLVDWSRINLPWPQGPGRNLSGLDSPAQADRPRFEIGDFFYPTGLTRWAEGHFLATPEQLALILPQALPAGLPAAPQPFVMQADPLPCPIVDTTTDPLAFGGFQTELYLLPPRPISLNNETVFLLTLVDERYFFRLKGATQLSPDTHLGWTDVISSLCLGLGITDLSAGLTPDPAYGVPNWDSPLWANYEDPALLLEAVCWNLGLLIVRDYNGGYRLVTPQLAIIQNLANTPTYTTAGGQVTAGGMLPDTVLVTFPKAFAHGSYINARPGPAWIDDSYEAVWTVQVPLASLGAPYNTLTSYPFVVGLQNTAKALFSLATDSTPTNSAALTAVALRLAANYYDLQRACILDGTYPGIRAWVPDGVSDLLFRYLDSGPETRVYPRPFNQLTTEFQHDIGPAPVPRRHLYGKITRQDVPLADGDYIRYSWTESVWNGQKWNDNPPNQQSGSMNAFELNNANLPNGTYIELKRQDDGSYLFTVGKGGGTPLDITYVSAFACIGGQPTGSTTTTTVLVP